MFSIGRAVGTLLPGRRVVVGGDIRLSTPALKQSLIEGLLLSGADVVDIGTVPTPVFYFAKEHIQADAGAMVTASHNPPEFNGLKLILGNLPITEQELDKIREIAESGLFRDAEGSFQTLNVIPAYRSFLSSAIPKPTNGICLVVDCGNGCYSHIAPDILREIGHEVHELFCEPDGRFPQRGPNSALPENLSFLRRFVRHEKADLGVAFDADGDRISFVDDLGRCIGSDKAIMILSAHILENHPGGKVIYDLKCSSAVPSFIAKAGGIPLAERSGHTFIKTRVIIENAAFGAELSGHYFYGDLGGRDDGLYTAAFMAGILAEKTVRLSELVDSQPEYATTPDIRIEYQGNRHELIEQIASRFPPESVSRLDGVRVNFDDGWALARVSVTEPVITLRFEGDSERALNKVVSQFLEEIPEIRQPVLETLERNKRISSRESD